MEGGSLDSLPLHAFTQSQMDRWLHNMRLELVAKARAFFLHPDYDTVVKGLPLPQPDASEEVNYAEAGKETGMNGISRGGVDRSDLGPQGEEGPLLATGKLVCMGSKLCLTPAKASSGRPCPLS